MSRLGRLLAVGEPPTREEELQVKLALVQQELDATNAELEALRSNVRGFLDEDRKWREEELRKMDAEPMGRLLDFLFGWVWRYDSNRREP